MRRMLSATAVLMAVATGSAQDDDPGRFQRDGDASGFLNVMPPVQASVLNSLELIGGAGGGVPLVLQRPERTG